MARKEQHDYDDIPGTYVFDAERSRQGFGINMFCMSLMKDENRKAFKANEAPSSRVITTACWSLAATSISPPSSVRPTGIRSSNSPPR
jgi:hypothetical protein